MTRSSTFLGNKCFTLFIWQSEDIRDDVKLATCSLNVKLESKSIPTTLHEATGFNCCIRENLVVFLQSGYIWAKRLYSCKGGCIRVRVVVFGQSSCVLANVVVFGQSGCDRAKVVVILQSCCNGAKWL